MSSAQVVGARPKKYLKMRKKKKVNPNLSYGKLARIKKKKKELIDESRKNLSSFISPKILLQLFLTDDEFLRVIPHWALAELCAAVVLCDDSFRLPK